MFLCPYELSLREFGDTVLVETSHADGMPRLTVVDDLGVTDSNTDW